METQLIEPVKPESTIQQRVRYIIENVLCKDIALVAKETGIPKGTLDNIVNGRVASIKDTHLAAIINTYEQLNANFILTGKGEPIVRPDASNLIATLRSIRDQANESLGERTRRPPTPHPRTLKPPTRHDDDEETEPNRYLFE